MHYVIIVVVVAIIVAVQVSIYRNTIKKIQGFSGIFAHDSSSYKYGNSDSVERNIKDADEDHLIMMLKAAGYEADAFYSVETNDDGLEEFVFDYKSARQCLLKDLPVEQGISSTHDNSTFEEIKKAINVYLHNNKGSVSDYHLMKDIVDRNCDAKEEEINAQIPVPLYLGLMGTMFGILVGIGYLWFSGDLSALLTGGNSNSGADGVEALLGGVALAMISSILGILLTTIGSMKAKVAKAEEEKNKHVFLSWIQANLLPNLSNDTAQTLERMSNNLVEFNETFSSNTEELGVTLSQVNEATKLQRQLMDSVEKLADKNISRQNIEVYNALKNSSEEIGTLARYLQNTNEYLTAVRDLNEKLDKDDRRSKALEEMLAFFKNETTQIEQRKAFISKTVGEIDSQLEEQLRKLGEHASENVNNFNLALGKQQDALQKKLDETQYIVEEMKNLGSIKESIVKFEKATAEQNKKIDQLTESIRQLAMAKAEGQDKPYQDYKIPKKPIWKKVAICCMTSIGSLALLGIIIANWGSIYSFLLDMFKF